MQRIPSARALARALALAPAVLAAAVPAGREAGDPGEEVMRAPGANARLPAGVRVGLLAVSTVVAIAFAADAVAQDPAAARIAALETEIARLQAELQQLHATAAVPAVDWQHGPRPLPQPIAAPPPSRAPRTRAPLSPLERWGWGGPLYTPWIGSPWGAWYGPVAAPWGRDPCAPPWLRPAPPYFADFHLPEN